jgi:cytochrome oxidase Cu insertion factor (SCO1/SenC/PrrC family)
LIGGAERVKINPVRRRPRRDRHPPMLSSLSPLRAATARFFGIAMLLASLGAAGCQSNSEAISDTSAQSSDGSYPSNNPADCLPAMTLIDQFGHPTSLAALQGRLVLIDFIYADCASACPVLTARFARIARLLGPRLGKDVTLVSVTIDPEHDHPARLLDYARTHDAAHPGWLFLTGRPADIDALLAIFKLKRERETDGTITHVGLSFLLGPDGRQLRMYNAMEAPPAIVVADVDRVLPPG